MSTATTRVTKCRCGGNETEEVRTPDGPHWAAEVCTRCRRYLRWLPKPEAKKIRRPAGHRDLVEKYSAGFCELCLAIPRDLPPGQTLEAQHVVEFEQGGGNERQNIWIVCTACHKLIHVMRTWWRRGDDRVTR